MWWRLIVPDNAKNRDQRPSGEFQIGGGSVMLFFGDQSRSMNA